MWGGGQWDRIRGTKYLELKVNHQLKKLNGNYYPKKTKCTSRIIGKLENKDNLKIKILKKNNHKSSQRRSSKTDI